MQNAGQAATPDVPLACWRMEPSGESGNHEPEVRLRIYPGFDERVNASTSHVPAVKRMVAR